MTVLIGFLMDCLCIAVAIVLGWRLARRHHAARPSTIVSVGVRTMPPGFKLPVTPTIECPDLIHVGAHVLHGRDMVAAGNPFAAFAIERVLPDGPQKHAVVVMDDAAFQALVGPVLLREGLERTQRTAAAMLGGGTRP